MDTIEQYREKLKTICDLAFANGVNEIGIEKLQGFDFHELDDDIQRNFLTACNDGFKKAQNLLIQEITKYQENLRSLNSNLKEYRRKRNKDKENEIKESINVVEQRLHTLSHIADGIAWQLIGGEIHIARRLHIQENTSKFLNFSNIKSAIEESNIINTEPLDFALISDLTHFVQIGDLLVRRKNEFCIMELKEGKVNQQITKFFESNEDLKDSTIDQKLKEKFDNTTIKQFKRVQRQIQRGTRAVKIIKDDEGIDPVSGSNITISTPNILTEYYHEDLRELCEQLMEKVWSYKVIDTCLHIGMYRDKGLAFARYAINKILEVQTENFVVVDWLTITQNLSEPIFSKPFPSDFICDFLIGKIKVIIGLDLDALIRIWNEIGLKTRWMSRKETAKRKKDSSGKGIFEINHKAIAIKIPDSDETVVGGGIISKIIYDSIRPNNIALSMLSVAKDDVE